LFLLTFSDTGETCVLKIRAGSVCHFFDQFTVGSDDIQLRLDWSELDCNEQPTLDADFIDHKTGKHRRVIGKRQCAHHTASSSGGGRRYEWVFDSVNRQFSVAVTWLSRVTESINVSDICLYEFIPAADRKPEHG
jgi:hypothetical protein